MFPVAICFFFATPPLLDQIVLCSTKSREQVVVLYGFGYYLDNLWFNDKQAPNLLFGGDLCAN